jgi:hypothetical protein
MRPLFDTPAPLFPPAPDLFDKGIRGRPSLVHAPGPRQTRAGGKKRRKYLGRIANYSKAEPADGPTMVWGWASVSTVNGAPVVDHEGDYIPIEALRKVAADFMANSQTGCALHMRGPSGEPVKVGTVTESIVIDDALAKSLDSDFQGRRGWLIGMRIDDSDVRAAVAKGMLPAFSVSGAGIRVPSNGV